MDDTDRNLFLSLGKLGESYNGQIYFKTAFKKADVGHNYIWIAYRVSEFILDKVTPLRAVPRREKCAPLPERHLQNGFDIGGNCIAT